MTRSFPRRKILAAAAVGILAVSLTACSSGGSGSSSSASGSYTLGINAELSGPVSFYGTTIRDGVKAWANQANAAGGIDGHKVKIVALDNAADSSRAAANVTQLATADNVSGILGNALSTDCTASATNAARYKVPLACLSVASAGPYVFSLGPDNTTVDTPALEAVKKVTGLSDPKTAFAYANTGTDEILAGTMAKKAAAAGVDLVTSQEFNLTASDLSSTSSQLIASHPDAVIVTGSGPNFVSILQALRAASVKVPIVWIDGTGNLNTLANVNLDNVYAFSTYKLASPTSPTATEKSFVEAITPFIGKSKVTESTLANGEYAVGYLTAAAWGQALKKCGYPCTGAQLQPILSKLSSNLSPMASGFSYDNSIHYPYPDWYLYKVPSAGVFDLADTYKAAVK